MSTNIYFIRCGEFVKIGIAAKAHDSERGD
jgi:hypothetical protein